MSSVYGKNRLATGFSKPSLNGYTAGTTASTFQTNLHDTTNSLPTGGSASSAIELSDDEDMGGSEGGIVLNVDDQTREHKRITEKGDREERDDDNRSQESGEVSDDQEAANEPVDVQYNTNPGEEFESVSFIVDPSPIHATKKLADLPSIQQEEQIRYAFYHLNRDEIDLNRPVICLKCFEEGHLKQDCQQSSTFPTFRLAGDHPIKLWISCCNCASKDHLVGDCPRADKAKVKRWSLADIDQSQIINLSLESGTRKLEKEAENRGMRPEGLSIKGRASRHTAGAGQHQKFESSDDDMLEHFHKRARVDGHQPTRYDRYDGPVRSPHRQRGGWYGTDSFGRRRSQSPPDDYRPNRDRRSPSPRQDMYRPGHNSRGPDTYRPPVPATKRRINVNLPKQDHSNANTGVFRGAEGKASARKQLPPPPIPKPNVQFELPTRKGSNTWASESSAPSSSSTPVASGQDQTKRGRKPKKPKRRSRPKPG